jgi:hypothetical protein
MNHIELPPQAPAARRLRLAGLLLFSVLLMMPAAISSAAPTAPPTDPVDRGEGHAISQPRNRRDLMRRLLGWFDLYLRPL